MPSLFCVFSPTASLLDPLYSYSFTHVMLISVVPVEWPKQKADVRLPSLVSIISRFEFRASHPHFPPIQGWYRCSIGVISRVKYYLPSKTVNMLAQALVFPHFDYCSSVWSNISLYHINELQILQNRLARSLLSADIRTPVNKMMKDLDWDKLTCRWEQQLLI